MLNKQETSFRKLDHVEICLQENTQSHQTTRLEDFHFIPRALADTNFLDLDVSTNLFGKQLSMPIMIAAMTGGHSEVRSLNEAIATTAEKFHLAMGVGSERAALENKNEYVIESFKVVIISLIASFVIFHVIPFNFLKFIMVNFSTYLLNLTL